VNYQSLSIELSNEPHQPIFDAKITESKQSNVFIGAEQLNGQGLFSRAKREGPAPPQESLAEPPEGRVDVHCIARFTQDTRIPLLSSQHDGRIYKACSEGRCEGPAPPRRSSPSRWMETSISTRTTSRTEGKREGQKRGYRANLQSKGEG